MHNLNITYNDTLKDLPCDQLRDLFVSVGWCDADDFSHADNFNKPFINATLVISAWHDGRLVGVVRVLSDKIIRSSLHDLVVLPAYKSAGIGKELVCRCIAQFPTSEWTVQTEERLVGYYEKLGFRLHPAVLTIPSAYARCE